jgi:hypothetical protein
MLSECEKAGINEMKGRGWYVKYVGLEVIG